MRPIRITIIANLFPPDVVGGAEVVALQHARALKSLGHDVSVVGTTGRCGWRDGRRITVEDGIKVTRLNSWNVYHVQQRPSGRASRPIWFLLDLFNPVMGRRVGRAVRENQADVVLCENLWNISTSVVARLTRDTPVALFLHDAALFCARATQEHRRGYRCERSPLCHLLVRVRQFQLKDVAAVISPSLFLLERFDATPLAQRALRAIVPNRFKPPNRPVVDESARMGYLFVGQLTTLKGVAVLEEFIRELEPRERLTIVGTGPRDVVARLQNAVTLGEVRMLGMCPPEVVYGEMAQARVLLFPSVWPENSPRVLLEAKALRLPVVAFDVGGVAEIIRPTADGDLIPQKNVMAFKLAARRRAQQGVARPAVPTRHELDDDYSDLASVLSRVIAAGTGSRRLRR